MNIYYALNANHWWAGHLPSKHVQSLRRCARHWRCNYDWNRDGWMCTHHSRGPPTNWRQLSSLLFLVTWLTLPISARHNISSTHQGNAVAWLLLLVKTQAAGLEEYGISERRPERDHDSSRDSTHLTNQNERKWLVQDHTGRITQPSLETSSSQMILIMMLINLSISIKNYFRDFMASEFGHDFQL